MVRGTTGGMRMPTTADLMSMWNASGLKEKLIFTFGMLVLFRFGINLPLYGVNNTYISNLASQDNLLGFLDLFSGGAIRAVSIFALGIGPYITSSIIMQLMAVIIPALEKLQKEDGEAGRRKIVTIHKGVYCCVSCLSSCSIYGFYGTCKCGYTWS